MDFDVGLLLFLFIFFVLPLIQRVLGSAKKAPPPGSRPGQRVPGVPPGRAEGRTRLPDASRTDTPANRSDADEPVRAQAEHAADLIPDDLWEILTGERRSPAPSRGQPAPAPEASFETEPKLEAEAEWEHDVEEVWRGERRAAQVPDPWEEGRHQEERLETPRPRDHEEIARAASTSRPPAPVTAGESASPAAAAPLPSPYATPTAAPRPAPARPYALNARSRRTPPSLSSRSELRRAFVLRELLGPPKALE